MDIFAEHVIKLAELKLQDQQKIAGSLRDAGSGALAAGMFALGPAMLSSYAQDKDVGKGVAGAEAWALPIGAMAGMAMLPPYRAAQSAQKNISKYINLFGTPEGPALPPMVAETGSDLGHLKDLIMDTVSRGKDDTVALISELLGK